eukprot:m.34014 g.34014  ORF g.34014 m.34014 type:complete len:267 (-) comp16916_c0_seq1:202-1002(-)
MANTEEKIKAAHTYIARVIDLFGPEACCLSFNGGKDSTVLFHLIREAVPHCYAKIKYVYFEQADEFEEVENFIDDISLKYGVEIIYPKGSFKDGLQEVIDTTEVKHIFIGTRSTDPNGTYLERMHITDGSWPNCVRVHPIIDWDYHEVWKYLQGPSRVYCALYDKGYTSLGSKLTTIQNEKLKLADGSFLPARELTDGQFERTNRSPTHAHSKPTTDTPTTHTDDGDGDAGLQSWPLHFVQGVVVGIVFGTLALHAVRAKCIYSML